ncbi:MAG: immunoglobulin-like domain-containing protein, partial [Patescibacteria group bacterium]
NASGNLVATSTPTAAYYLATSSIASQLLYASTTAITASGTASTTALTVSNLTTTRIPFLTTASLFTDDSDLIFTSGNLLTATYASSTSLSTSQGAWFATSGGNVGIGDTSPEGLLHVKDGSAGTIAATTWTNMILESSDTTSNDLQFQSPNNAQARIVYGDTDDNDVGWTTYDHNINAYQIGVNAGVRITIDSTGNVGIGTTSPVSTLSIQGSLCVRDTGSCGTTAGTIYATTATVQDIDLAENYQTIDATLSAGEIVALDSTTPTYIRRASSGDTLLGVISTSPGLLLGSQLPNSKPVALSGRAPVKVSNEGGSIAIGDRIALSSVVGVGKKAASGETIGVALEAMTGASGTIEVFINLRNHIDPTVFSITASSTVAIGTTTPDTAYALYVNGDAAATSFVNLSSREYKKDIEYYDDEDKRSVLEKIKSTGVATYYYNGEACGTVHDTNATNGGANDTNTEGCQKRLGLIAEEAPLEVLSANRKGVDIYKLSTFILAGVQELAKRLEAVELRVTKIEELLGTTTPASQGGTPFIKGGITDFLAALGARITQGLAEFKTLVVEALTIGSTTKPSGITLYDEVTKEPYCLSIANGQPMSRQGACTIQSSISNNQNTPPPTSGRSAPLDRGMTPLPPQTASAPLDRGDTEPPVITVNGNNHAEIAMGANYADLGASVTDNKDSNLGLYAIVDGVDVGSASNIQLDTASSSTYTIEYYSTDQAGNRGTAQRTVVVGAGAPTLAENTTAPTGEGILETATSSPEANLPLAETPAVDVVVETAPAPAPAPEPAPEPTSEPVAVYEPASDSPASSTPEVL